MDKQIKDFLNDTVLSEYLLTRAQSTYVHTTSVPGGCLLKMKTWFHLPGVWAQRFGAGNEIRSIRWDNDLLHISDPEVQVLMIEAADFFNNPTEASPLHDSSFYFYSQSSLMEPHHVSEELALADVSSVMTFFKNKLTQVSDARRSVKQLIFNNMRLFDFEPRDKKKWEQKSVNREKHQLGHEKSSLEPKNMLWKASGVLAKAQNGSHWDPQD